MSAESQQPIELPAPGPASHDTAAMVEYLAEFVTVNKREKIRAVLEERTDYLTVALEDIFQPHNASAVLRTCECLGVQNVHIIEGRNRYRVNPEVALGSAKWLSLHRYQQPEADATELCINALRAQGYRIVATSPEGEDTYTPDDLPLDRPVALFFGTEEQGLSAAALAGAELRLRLPQFGFTQSYNISVSVAIALSALTRRLRAEPVAWGLSAGRKAELTLAFYRQIVTRHELLEERFFAGRS